MRPDALDVWGCAAGLLLIVSCCLLSVLLWALFIRAVA
jgi:hypothetical protein